MRFTEFKVSDEQQLDELKMSPGSLTKFMSSPAAQGMRAGFEAELIFGGMEASEPEPDYDQDRRARSIQDIIDFFSVDDYGYGMSLRQARELRDSMEEEYLEWVRDHAMEKWNDLGLDGYLEWYEENAWDLSQEIRDDLESNFGEERAQEILAAGPGNPDYDSAEEDARAEMERAAERSWNKEDSDYEQAREEFLGDYDEQPDEEDWLRYKGIRYMSDVENYEYQLDWPYWSGGTEMSYRDIANNLAASLSVKTKVEGYGTKDSTSWYLESDSSIEPNRGDDGLGVEIVSPPMPLPEAVEMLDKFFTWARNNDAYTNSTTGFHMGVSLPNGNEKIDYVKLALFLGDQYVLEQFGRLANSYCKSSLEKVKQKANIDPAHVMKLMRAGMMELASQTIHGLTTNKYSSINVHDSYIEFRSAGGENYFNDIGKLKNTMLRYAQAMAISADPNAYREEYAKKLYSLLRPSSDMTNTIEYFAKYSAGTISKEQLTTMLSIARGERMIRRETDPQKIDVWWWVVTKTGLQGNIEVAARSRQEAIDKARHEWGIQWTEPDSAFQARPVRKYEVEPTGAQA